MKIRQGFVSNSSSCSFSILRSHMSLKQYDHLRNHIEYAHLKKWKDKSGWPSSNCGEGDRWDIVLEDNVVTCSTNMDNFDLLEFVVDVLGIPDSGIVDHYHS